MRNSFILLFFWLSMASSVVSFAGSRAHAQAEPDLMCRSSDVIDAGYWLSLYGTVVEIGAISYLRNTALRREEVKISFPDRECSSILIELAEHSEEIEFQWSAQMKEYGKGALTLKIAGVEIPLLFRKMTCEFRREGALEEMRSLCRGGQ